MERHESRALWFLREGDRVVRVGLGNIAALLWIGLALSTPAFADLVIPAGGNVAIAGGTLDLGCGDIVVAGALQIGGGLARNVRNVTIQPGGTLDGGSGTITLSGNWSNTGSFVAGTSTVSFVDAAGCSTTSTITGNTTFFNLSLVSTAGKTYAIQAGSTQTIAGNLTIQGVSGTPIRIVSTNPGFQASTDLLPGGTQSILHVDVRDNWGVGQVLAPGQTNEGNGTNFPGWFGALVAAIVVPTLDWAGLALLAILVVGLGMVAARYRGANGNQRVGS